MAGAASLALNKFMFSNMPYDPETELTPIVILSRLPHIFVVNAKVEAKTLKELVDYAKANPGKLSAGVPGVGTTAHITLEAFMAETGAKMTVVPYRSEPQMLTDLVGGQLDFACTLTTSPGPHVQAGRLRALAVTSATRTQQLPDVPTVEQAGFPGFEATAWFALAAPTGTPADIIAKINAAANAFIRSAKGRRIETSSTRCRPAARRGNESLHRRRSPQMGARSSRRQRFRCSSPLSRARSRSPRTEVRSIARRKAAEFASGRHHGAFNCRSRSMTRGGLW